MEDVSRVVLAARPSYGVVPSDFRIEAGERVEGCRPGMVRVRPRMFGLNAGLKVRLGTGSSTTFGPAIEPGDTPASDGVGVVVESCFEGLAEGDLVVGVLSWATSTVVDGATMRRLDPGADPLRHLTILGHVGLTAYAALMNAGNLQPGETVWVSAAAGGVGTCAVQIADRVGAKVVASAGGPARTEFLRRQLNVHHVVDRTHDLKSQLVAAAPDGVDVYLDSVGGDHLAVALEVMRECGRIVLVGQSGGPSHEPVFASASRLIDQRIALLGFSVHDHPKARPMLEEFVERSDHERPMVSVAHIQHGFASLPEAFCDMLVGTGIGRAVVALDGE